MNSEFKNIEAIIFDVDGTLYFQKPVRFAMLKSLLKYYLLRPWKWKQLYGIYLFRRFRETEQCRNMPYDGQLALVGSKAGLTKSELGKIIRYWMFEYPLFLIEEYRDRELLSFLHRIQKDGKKIIIYSDYPPEEKLKCLGVEADYIFYPGMGGIMGLKPSLESMRHIMNTVGFLPESFLYIGDRADRDGKSAELAGIPFWLVHNRKISFRNFNE